MNRFDRLLVVSTFAFLALGVALTLAIIIGIWGEFDSDTMWKAIGTIGVLFLFSGFLHSLAKGMCEQPKERDKSSSGK